MQAARLNCFRRFISLLIVIATVLAMPLWAQVSRGTLTGTVTDPSGAVVASATVSATHAGTGVTRTTSTNSSGIYRFDAVDIGSYSVSTQASGFAVSRKTGVDVAAARTVEVDFALQVGQANQELTVEASGAEVALQTSEQVRAGHLSERAIANLPLVGLDTLTLAQTVPGVVVSPNGNINQNGTMVYTVNGQRPRSNNFMIDGVENNDISVTGPAYTITNPDAVEEVTVQTANFSAEFGRAGGGVINQVTRSGTSSYHGSATYIYTGSAFKSLNYNQKRNHSLTRPPRDIENIPSFTFGGPLKVPFFNSGKRKAFFFGAGQWDHDYGRASFNITVPSAAGFAVLQPLAGTCPNVARYLQALGAIRATGSLSNISIANNNAATSCTGTTRAGQNVEVGTFTRVDASFALDTNHQIRIDFIPSEKQTMSFRWLYDKNSSGPSFNNLPGFDNGFNGITLGMAFTDTYVLNPHWTNEFRFNYGRIGFDFPFLAGDAFHATLPNYAISGITGFGGATNIPQFRFANNWQYADVMTIVKGTHQFRFGGDLLRQLARQHPPFNERGSFVYGAGQAGTGITNLADFIDDFGGSAGSANRLFGNSIYHPDLFRQSYFFQDSWKATRDLTLNLGVRYENYGTPMNIFTIAAFTDYDPVNFGTPHKVKSDNNNFAPTVGFAWSPSGRFLGENKTVIRGGYQLSYDTQFNNLLSNIAGSTPNALGNTVSSSTSAALQRGTPGFSALLPTVPTPLDKTTAQSNLFDKNTVNPYTQRWSLGFQREIPGDAILDISYVGSVSRKLYRTIDMNPVVNTATGDRLHTELQVTAPTSAANIAKRQGEGIRTVRCSCSNADYNGLQAEVRRRFSGTPVGNFGVNVAYTWGHSLDEISDVFGQLSNASSFQSVSQVLGASRRLDYGDSDFDYRHNAVASWVWDIRGPKGGVLGQILGGWTMSGIQRFQTGFPYTIHNGADRDGDGQSGPDRPDISNINAPLNTRAILKASCATGYGNPDLTGTPCVDPATVHFVQATGLPTAKTVRRNSVHGNGLDRLDLNIQKNFRISERFNMRYGLNVSNFLNTVNLTSVPGRLVVGTAASRFLDVTQLNSTGRSMRMMLRLSF